MATLVTMEQIRMEAARRGMAEVAMAFAHVIEQHPVMGALRWDQSNAGDQHVYKTYMGEATAPHQDPDATYTASTEERVIDRIATVRPLGGVIKEPFLGKGFGTPAERIKWRAEACVKQFMSSFVSGRYVTAATITGLSSASLTFVQAGPHWDETARGMGRGVALVKIRKDGADFYVSLKAGFDTTYGTEVGPYTAAVATVDITIASANPYYWVTLTLDRNALPAATDVGSIDFTSTTYTFDGVQSLCATAQSVNVTTATGENVNLGHLDYIASLVKTGGQRICLVNPTTFLNIKAAARAVPGASLAEAAGLKDTLSWMNGSMLVMLEDNIPHNITHGGTANCTYMVCFDVDRGIRGLYGTNDRAEAMGQMLGGLSVRNTGEAETSDHELTKVLAYWSIWNPQRYGLSILNGIKN